MFLTRKFIFLFCAWLKPSFTTTGIGRFFLCSLLQKKKKKKSLIKDLLLSICLINVVIEIS